MGQKTTEMPEDDLRESLKNQGPGKKFQVELLP